MILDSELYDTENLYKCNFNKLSGSFFIFIPSPRNNKKKDIIKFSIYFSRVYIFLCIFFYHSKCFIHLNWHFHFILIQCLHCERTFLFSCVSLSLYFPSDFIVSYECAFSFSRNSTTDTAYASCFIRLSIWQPPKWAILLFSTEIRPAMNSRLEINLSFL